MKIHLLAFVSLSFIIGCGEKLADNNIEAQNSTPSADETKGALTPSSGVNPANEPLAPRFEPIGPSPLLYPNGGYISGGGGGHHLTCAQIEGQACATDNPPPFDEGRISCKKGRPVCAPDVQELLYYLYIEDFANSFIEIPTSNVSDPSSTIYSRYLAGRAPIYNEQNIKYGVCSASFLCMQNQDGIYTDIANYLSADNGLIVTWFSPTTLINLELDSIINGMVTECIVLASTKVGVNPFYGMTFNMIVSSDDEKIYFQLTPIEE